MTGPSAIPINFGLTDSAVEKIRAFTDICRAKGTADPVPAMCWLVFEISPSGEHQVRNHPEIGVYDRGELPAHAIQTVGDLELVFSVPQDVAREFVGQQVDYSDSRGFFFAA